MDKARRPHVGRTWSVERTRGPYRPAQPVNLRPIARKQNFRGPTKPAHGPTESQ